jgi:5,10-methenyltetrahydrofolate synthetase
MRLMDPQTLKRWRRSERERLIGARLALGAEVIDAWRRRIDAHLEGEFSDLAGSTIALCWPIKNEYDARHLARRLRERGSRTALPVVQSRDSALAFREWHPGVRLARGPLDIAYPVDTPELVPETVLLPMNGWDSRGYRLGYGGGYFDRTLASLVRKPLVIGIGYEMARIETIHPQPWDIPMDYVVTERGAYRRLVDGLALTGRSGSDAQS